MGRTYAGILGPVSFGIVVARSLIGGDSVESTLYAAPLALFAFAAIGYVIGFIADRTIVEAIETQFHTRLQAKGTAEASAMEGTNLVSGTERPA